MGPDNPIAPVMVPQVQTPDTVAPEVPIPGVVPVAPLVLSAPDVVLNQPIIDAAKNTALYTQILVALVLLLGSAGLVIARRYESPGPKAIAVGMGAVSLIVAAVMFSQDWIPSEVLPSGLALLAIAAAAAGPVIQLTAPDQKVLDELESATTEANELEEDLESAEEEIEKSLKVVEGLKKGLETAKAEAKAVGGKVADAEKSAQQAVERADVAEKAAAEAVEARHTAESAQATAEAEATTLRGHAERAEANSADLQVRLSSFEERKVADQAASALSVAEEDLVDRNEASNLDPKRPTGCRSRATASCRPLHQSDAVGAADASWTAVEEAAKGRSHNRGQRLPRYVNPLDAAAEAIANGVKILDSDGLAQQLADADVEHGKAADALTRLNSEARNADVSTRSSWLLSLQSC